MVKLEELDNRLKRLVELQKNNIRRIFTEITLPERIRSEAVKERYANEVVKVFLNWQGIFFDPSTKVSNTDQTGFKFYTDDIRREVYKQIEESSRTVDKLTGNFKLKLLSDSFLGLDGGLSSSDKSPSPIKWAYFFIVGSFQDNLIWVTSEDAQKLFGENADTDLGRFGNGHLWRVPASKEAKYQRWFKAKGVNYNDSKHPQSGQKGRQQDLDAIFNKVPVEQLITEPAIRKAIEMIGKDTTIKF